MNLLRISPSICILCEFSTSKTTFTRKPSIVRSLRLPCSAPIEARGTDQPRAPMLRSIACILGIQPKNTTSVFFKMPFPKTLNISWYRFACALSTILPKVCVQSHEGFVGTIIEPVCCSSLVTSSGEQDELCCNWVLKWGICSCKAFCCTFPQRLAEPLQVEEKSF